MSTRKPKRITKEEPHKKLDPREVKSRSTARPAASRRDIDPYYDEYQFQDSVNGSRTTPERETRYQRSVRDVYDTPEIEQEISYQDDFEELRKRSEKRGPSKARRVIGKIILYLQLVASVVVMILLLRFHVLKDSTMIIIGIVMALLWLIVFISQRKHFNKSQAVGMVVSIIVSVALVCVSLLLVRTNSMLHTVTAGRTYDISRYDVAVLDTNPAQTMADTGSYTFAIQPSWHPEELASVIEQVKKDVGGEISTVQVDSALSQAQALLDGDVDAVIYNDAFTSTILEQYETYEEQVRILNTYTQKTEAQEVQAVDVDISTDAFLVFISGTDSEGEISMTGRSDVNIVAGINLESKQILLITIPRDYYVEFPGVTAAGQRDKLTHAGIYGMDELVATVQNLLGHSINYYVRVNFSSMTNIVDALGGITIYNEQDFISHGGYHFPAGTLDLTGLEALHYVRERFAFKDGDFARGRNQVKVIQAMMDKAVSVNSLTNYSALTDAVTQSIATNVPMDTIMDLVNVQLNENPEWHLVSYQMLGQVMFQPCQSANGAYLSVDMPYQESIDNAMILLGQLINGEEVSEDLQLTADDELTFVVEPVG